MRPRTCLTVLLGSLLLGAACAQLPPFHSDSVPDRFAPGGNVAAQPKQITNSIGMKLVRIDPGNFKMGSRTDVTSHDANETQHEVESTTVFWMGIHEVTQDQFEKVMDYNPSHFSRNGKGKPGVEYDEGGRPAGGNDLVPADTRAFPVENVSWDEANEFCMKLSAQGEEKGRTYRLPTEAEWEYACRAGKNTKYHNGNDEGDLEKVDWYAGNSGRRLHRVGKKKPNAWGLYDMHGNVWEWCSDWYDKDYYNTSPLVNPEGPSEGTCRVIRGGSWLYDANNCRAAFRNAGMPGIRNVNGGFRVVCVPANK